MNLNVGTRACLVLFAALLAFAACASPVSAAWVYKGQYTDTSGDSYGDYVIVIQQTTKYWYDADQDLWKEEITAVGEAKYYNNLFDTWQPAWGSYGVYGYEEGYFTVWSQYGDESVTYTSPIVEKKQMYGSGTIYSGIRYTETNGDGDVGGDYVAVGVAGSVTSSVGAQCWTSCGTY
ncbi:MULTISPECIES: hypothetical protein [Methanoculleus]|uniref:Uncharacterized protein n=2 Tax=Methanoculleus TaxID=45989 RepID=A3CW34_METMJ|nr:MULTISPECIES: hypothetical protein [Methanoculleus]ABN57584.1 hypothetical protein Memar_1657 [Methanoculleus marisnigri JR1]UYU18985.1 hypothetical protein OH143_02505 [Methanoculleus submarinus]